MSNKFCDCSEDGWCTRYAREMRGRFREICAGVNCDLGTAAAFREQWSREADPVMTGRSVGAYMPLLLKTAQAPGDTVAMTAAVYSLHRAHPGRFLTAVESPHPEVWENNPDVVPAESIPDALPLQMHYPAIHQSNQRAIHFMQGWCEHLSYALGINVPLLTNRPHLYFSEPAPAVDDSYFHWIICSGGKSDLTNKLWGHHNYQSVVDRLIGNVLFVQVGDRVEDHPRLHGAVNMVGKTTLRELFVLMRRARGVVCGVSLLMHVAAALEKPAIVIAGGREPVAWNAYPRQQYLHNVGMLGCSSPQGDVGGACWRGRVSPLDDGTILDEHPCERPVNGTPTRLTRCTIPACMAAINPGMVVEQVTGYNRQYEHAPHC